MGQQVQRTDFRFAAVAVPRLVELGVRRESFNVEVDRRASESHNLLDIQCSNIIGVKDI